MKKNGALAKGEKDLVDAHETVVLVFSITSIAQSNEGTTHGN
jgi:hypothetical protein